MYTKRTHIPKNRNLTVCEYRHSGDDYSLFPETSPSVCSFLKKFSNLIHTGLDSRLNKIELNYIHDFALFWKLPKTSFSVKEVWRISRQSFCLNIASLKCGETLLSLVDVEARNFAMRFSHSPLSLILFLMLVFSRFLWRQSKYSSLPAGVISTEGMDDNSKMFIVSKFRQRKSNRVKTKSYISVRSILIIILEYAYKVALKHVVNNNEEAKQKVILIWKIESFVEVRC